MGGLFGGGTISHEEPRINGFRVQQSTYGAVMPIVFGTTRITGNVIDYVDFTAVPHTKTQRAGKGGGQKYSETTYTYTVAAIISLCEGDILGIGRVWKDKEILHLSVLGGITPKPGGDLGAIAEWLIARTAGLVKYDAAAFLGNNQAAWNYMQTKHPERALTYAKTAYVCSPAFDLGNSGALPNLSFEVLGKNVYGNNIPDARPAEIIKELLTSEQFGANFPSECIGDLGLYDNYCMATGFFLSPALTEQKECQEYITDICQCTNSETVWSQGKLKIVPYSDEPAVGNNYTYTPPHAPLYDLNDDDFLCGGDDEPVICKPKLSADAYNVQPVEFLNRANGYNIETIEARDDANVSSVGLRQADPVNLHYICEKNIARLAAQAILQRKLYIRKEYNFKLGWKYCLLEPMDIVTISDSRLGLNKEPVRITKIEEDENGDLQVMAEECPFGVHGVTQYPSQDANRTEINYNVPAGNITNPIIFEAPAELTQNGFEIYIAVSGGQYWGGCNVWASETGDSYKCIGTIKAPARCGVLTSPLPVGKTIDTANQISVKLSSGQLFSGTQQDADNLNTLCWVDGEFMAYLSATLTAPDTYALYYLNRGAFSSTIAAHDAGAKFVRIEDSLFKHSYTKDQIGKTIYLKFTSFNVFGGGEQSLADVQAYSHKIANVLPPEVTNIILDEDTYILRDGTVLSDVIVNFTEPKYSVLGHYNVYFDLNNNGTWQYFGPAQSGKGYRIKALPQAKTVKVKVTVVNKWSTESDGVVSEPYTITGKSEPPPDVSGLLLNQDEYNRANIILQWNAIDPKVAPDVRGYEVRLGQEWNTAARISGTLFDTKHNYAVTANGTYTFLVKAIDNSGNYSSKATAANITVIVVPDATVNLKGQQQPEDRSILKITFDASPGKDIVGYELRHGGNWESGKLIAFTKETAHLWTIPASGSYNIMVKAKTVAGFMSNPANIAVMATIEPGDVTGFQITQDLSDHSLLQLKWDNAIYSDLAFFEIREGVSWDAGRLIVTGLAGLEYNVRINQEREYNFWIKAVNRAGKYSQYPAKVSAVYNLHPLPVTSIVVTQDENDRSLINVTWKGISELDFLYYEVRHGWTWETAKVLTQTKETKFQFRPEDGSGNIKILIKAVSTAGFYSTEASDSLYALMEPQDVENFIVQQNGEFAELYWDRAYQNDIVGYEIREGWTFDYGQLIATNITGNSYKYKVDFDGIYHYHIKAINRSNRYSVRAVEQQLTIIDLPPKNIIQSFNEIQIQNGTHENTEFAKSEINWQTVGGKWTDYPTTKFEEVGGKQVLRLKRDANGKYPATGTYTCQQIDIGRVLTANIAIKFLSTVKFRGETTATLQMRTSKDAKEWTIWKDFLPAKFVFRYIELRVILSTANPAKTPEVNCFDIMIDLPDIEKAGTVKVSVGGIRVTYNADFFIVPIVTPYAIGEGVRVEILNRDKTGFTAKILNLQNQDVGGIMDWRARGY